MLRSLFNKTKKYRIGKLKPVLYLYDKKTATILFNKNVAYEINGDCYELACTSVSYSCTSSDSGRYQFESTVAATLDERADNYSIVKQLLSKGWLVGFVTLEGDRFLVSPEFSAQVTYDFLINDSEKTNTTTITFKTTTNVPNMTVIPDFQVTNTLRAEDCKYTLGEVSTLHLCKTDSTTVAVNNSTLTVKCDEVQAVEYNTNTLSFQETYDGEYFEQTLTFDVPFSNLEHSFHYNLIEYAKNEYYAILTTKQGNIILGGYEYGMLPTYQIQAGNDDKNNVTFTLKYYSSTHGVFVADKIKFQKVNPYNYILMEWECVNGVYGCVVLMQVEKESGDVTFYALEGYEDKYEYPISGTYSSVYTTDFGVKLYNDEVLCVIEPCVNYFPDYAIFTDVNQRNTLGYAANCLVTVEENEFADVDIDYSTIAITNKSTQPYTLVFEDANGFKYELYCDVQIPQTIENLRNITAAPITFEYTMSKKLQEVDGFLASEKVGLIPSGKASTLEITIPKNETSEPINHQLEIVYKNGDKEILKIYQDRLYTKLVDNDTEMCDGFDLYKYYLKLEGYTVDSVNTSVGYVKGELIEENSTVCRITEPEPILPIDFEIS